MQVQKEAYSNFVNSINSEQTRHIYEYSLLQFLNHYQLDFDSLLKLEQQEISEYITNYLVEKNVSRSYKIVIFSSIKHALEMNDILPIMKISVETADTELENNEIAITIIGKLEKQEHDVPFTDISAKSIIDGYENLKPWVKEGIVHRIGQPEEHTKVASRSLEVKYRMLDEFYPEDEMGHHDIDENEIAKTLVPYIKSLLEIYSRLYPNVNN